MWYIFEKKTYQEQIIQGANNFATHDLIFTDGKKKDFGVELFKIKQCIRLTGIRLIYALH